MCCEGGYKLQFILQKVRRDKNISQKQLSKMTKISASYIQKLESGKRSKPSYEVVTNIAAALNVKPEALFLNEE